MKHFPGGQGQPTQIVAKQESGDQVISTLQGINGVAAADYLRDGVALPGQNPPPIKVVNGNVIINATLDFAPDSLKARSLIPVIREQVKKIDSTILVGGGSAVNYDVGVAANRDNHTIIPIVLILIALILAAHWSAPTKYINESKIYYKAKSVVPSFIKSEAAKLKF